NEERTRIGLLARGAGLVLGPIREQAGGEAPHALDLITMNLLRLMRGDEDQGGFRGPKRLSESGGHPLIGMNLVGASQVDEPATGANREGCVVLPDLGRGVGD